MYYLVKIRDCFSQKQRMNPHYSMRAYARDLGIHPGTLGQVLNGRRSLPLKNAGEVVRKLNLGPKERTLFLESLYRVKTSIDQINITDEDTRFMLDESYYKVIAEWEHYAVLTLFDVVNFEANVTEISQRLGITENRADVVLNNLLTCGLIKQVDGVLVKSHSSIRTTEDISSQALRESHLEALEIGKQKLDKVAVDMRDYSSMTIAVDPNKMTEAKTIIREFRQKMLALLRDGNRTGVYQLAIQFYPLTNDQSN